MSQRQTRSLLTKRRVLVAGAAVVCLLVLAVLGAGWYYASLLHSGGLKPDYSPDELNLRVVSVTADSIALSNKPGEDLDSLTDDELWGLEGQSGYGRVSDVLQVNGGKVTRRFQLMAGTMAAGDSARLDSFAFQGDPFSARGLPFESVSIPSPLGDLPAWRLRGESSVWVIFVHGWRSDREEALRILPTVSALGFSSLVITYRNDEGAPPSEDGLIRFGATEWRDLEAAVQYATQQGAESVVLYGYSMGGGIAVRFLEESAQAGVVAGAVLDSPILDFNAVVAFQGHRRGVPGFVIAAGKQIAAWRFDLDWSEVDHLEPVDRLRVPILLFHGDDDDVVPVTTSRRLARERPDIVTYFEAATAGHVRSWNIGPALYEQRVTDFLTSLMNGRGQ